MVVKVGAPLLECARRMADEEVGSLVVVDDEDLRGILTRRDVLAALESTPSSISQAVAADIMSTPVRAAASGTTVTNAMALMHAAGIRHLPVVDDDEVIGIVSRLDVLEMWADSVSHLQAELAASDATAVPPAAV